MAEIHFLTGTKPTAADLASEAIDRSKQVKPFPFIDTSILSEGEAIEMLKAAKLKVLADFYVGTPQGAQFKKQFDQKLDTLYRGLHRGTNILGTKSLTRPASGWLSWQQKGFTPKVGLKNLFEDAPEGAQVRGIGVIPELDCAALWPTLSQSEWQAQNPNAPVNIYQSYAIAQAAGKAACTEENIWRKILNDNLTKCAHHPLYEFASSSDKNAFPLVASKSVDHANAISALQTQSKISRAVLRQWIDSGIVYENTKVHRPNSTPGPYTPEETIYLVKRGEQDGVGFLDPVTIATLVSLGKVVVAVLGALAAAATAAGVLLNAIKSKRPTAAQAFESSTQGWAGQTWGADKLDFTGQAGQPPDQTTGQCDPGYVLQNGICVPTSQAGGGLFSKENAPFLILGGAGLFFALNSKK